MVDRYWTGGLATAPYPGGRSAGAVAFDPHLGSEGLRGAALLLIVDFLEIGIDDFVAAAASGPARGRATTRWAALAGARLLRLLCLIECLADLHRGLRQGLRFGLDLLGVVAPESVFKRYNRLLHRLAIGFGDLVSGFVQAAFGRVDQGIGAVFRLDQLALAFVFLGMRFGILDHAVDIRLGEPARSLDANLLLFAGRLVLGRDIDDDVGIYVVRLLDFRRAA